MLYHGTDRYALGEILEHGLRPASDLAAEGRAVRWGCSIGVYLTPSYGLAYHYALSTAGQDEAVVLGIDVRGLEPREDPDGSHEPGASLLLEGAIPTQRIVGASVNKNRFAAVREPTELVLDVRAAALGMLERSFAVASVEEASDEVWDALLDAEMDVLAAELLRLRAGYWLDGRAGAERLRLVRALDRLRCSGAVTDECARTLVESRLVELTQEGGEVTPWGRALLSEAGARGMRGGG